MQLIEAFVRNPVKVSVGVLIVALFGVIALIRMPMQLTPEVEIPTLTITTRWPGASPMEVESEIIQEQEEQLKGVEGLTKMSSQSRDSQGEITLEFAVGTSIDQALVKVNSRLQQVPEYPPEADQPVITTANANDSRIAWFILGPLPPSAEQLSAFARQHPPLKAELDRIATTENHGLMMLRLRRLAAKHPEVRQLLPTVDVTKLLRFAEDNIKAEFERVPGVARSEVLGGREEEMQVVVDPKMLAARQLTIADLRRALQTENKDTSGGDLWEDKRRWVIRTLGKFQSPEQIRNVIVARRDDAPVYVRDIAEVRLGYKKPTGIVRRFGTDCIAINASRSIGANVLDVMDGLRATNRDMNETLLKPRGLELIQVYDETEYINSAVSLVNNNIVIGGALTIAILLVFLRSPRSTLVISLAIPTSIIGTFLILHMLGRSLNVISLAGLSFAVGMLVDNAIVVLENIFRRYQMGEAPMTAAVRGAQEVWGAVVASTLTTLAVFVPVVFVQQEAGQLFRDISLAISAAVGLSMIVAIIVIPTASARLLSDNRPRVEGGADDPLRPADSYGLVARLLSPFNVLGRWFVSVVVGLNHWLHRGLLRRLVLIGGLTAAAIGISLWTMPKAEYLPSGNRNLVIAMMFPPPGYSLPKLLSLGEGLEESIRPHWDVDPGSPEEAKLPFPAIEDFFFVVREGQVFFGMRSREPLLAGNLPGLIYAVSGQIPGTRVMAFQTSLFGRGLTAGRTVDIEFTGPDLRRLVQLGGQTMVQLGVQGTGEVTQLVGGPGARARPVPSLDLSSPEVHILPKLEQAADMGEQADSLGYAVDALVDGAFAGDYYLGADKIDLTIIGKDRYAGRTQDLAALPIATAGGQLVPLGAIAHITHSSGPEQVNHRERQRAITVEVTPPAHMALGDAVQRIDEALVQKLRGTEQLAGGYHVHLGGTADKLAEAWRALRWNLVLALLITYLLMAALFESWLYPLVIIFTVPLGAVGGFLGLWLFNFFKPQPLDVLTMLGFVILIGTVVNNPILIVHQTLNYMREEGMSQAEAIVESVRTRIRPIFMATVTTVLGLLPLVLIPGAGSELYRGLGSVVLGGLVVSTVFTLILTPTLFSVTMDAKAGFLSLVSKLRRRRMLPAVSEDFEVEAAELEDESLAEIDADARLRAS